jgi:hypothetical protein
MITVYISTDLGPDYTQADLDGYAENLASHLHERFGVDVEVEQVLGGGSRGPCPDNDEIAQYVRDLQAGDGWIDLLPEEATPDSERTQRADHIRDEQKDPEGTPERLYRGWRLDKY